MIIVTTKSLLLLLGLLLIADASASLLILISILLVITLTALAQYFDNRKFTWGCTLFYLIFCLINPLATVFFPLIIFDFLKYNSKKYLPLLILPPLLASWNGQMTFSLTFLCLAAISTLVNHLFFHIGALDEITKDMRDKYTEHGLALQQKNKDLLEKQDYEIHLATLEERNRIARDIHDHVGHGLSRAILQTGALQALNGDDKLAPFLDGLQETLTDAMNNIRGSVHDLKDDAVDLYEAVNKILENTPFKINLNYDISQSVPNPVKYCFLTVLKEGLTNATKHSDATDLDITLQEHPALYQLLLADNGTGEPQTTGRGIGLQNIEERVQNLGGYCNFTYKNGFRIFITIPKGGQS